MSKNLPNMLQDTISKIREMVDVNSVIGDPITTPDGVTIVPVSKVSVGFGGGGMRRATPCSRMYPPGRFARVSKNSQSISSLPFGVKESVRVHAQSGWSGCAYDDVSTIRPPAPRVTFDGIGELASQRNSSAVSPPSSENQVARPAMSSAQSPLR